MHIVHFNTKYSNLEEALMHKDGVAVIGIFFQVNIYLIVIVIFIN